MQAKTRDEFERHYARARAAAARHRLYAARMKREDREADANLLNALADSEEIQARRMLMYLRGKLGDSEAYLRDQLTAKAETGGTAYPRLADQLSQSGDNKAAEAFEQFAQAADHQHHLLQQALDKTVGKETSYFVCQVCGHVVTDEPPQNCPICNAVREKFKLI